MAARGSEGSLGGAGMGWGMATWERVRVKSRQASCKLKALEFKPWPIVPSCGGWGWEV